MGKVNAIRRMTGLPQIAAAMLLTGLAACAPPEPAFPELPRLNVATRITTKNMCSYGISPEITVRNTPQGTERYTLRMTNIDVLFGEPWQITAPAQRGGFAEGSIPEFPAPCLGALQANLQRPYHLYRFEVLALDEQGRPLAYGQSTVPVYGIDRALAHERAAAAGRRPSFDDDAELSPLDRTTRLPLDPALVPALPEELYQR
jgi:hypothetical protein